MNLQEYIAGVQVGSIDPRQTVFQYIQKAHDAQIHYNTFITIDGDYAMARVDDMAKRGPLYGAPIAVKDLICVEGMRTTFGSLMSESFIPGYSATCIQKLEAAGACIIGKTNMDEFAMGTTNENSAYGPVANPVGAASGAAGVLDEASNKVSASNIPGGSGGGSAAAVSADLCLAALGTDTGGSVRQPAFLTGVVGMKPTYGRISRYGVQAMASSLDQVGVNTKCVADACLLVSIMSGCDENDATSVDRDDVARWHDALKSGSIGAGSLAGKRIGYIEEFFGEGLDADVAHHTRAMIERCREAGATIVPLHFSLMKYIVAVYYILVPAEVSTNLARFDGIRG